MRPLYEIDKEIEQAIAECVDPETGEITDIEKLDTLYIERNQKIKNVALYLKNQRAYAAGLAAEKAEFAKRLKAAEKEIEGLQNWLTAVLSGEKFIDTECTVSFRKSTKVEITDIDLIPPCFGNTKVTFEPDKKAIKEAINGGLEVDGAKLVTNLNISIK